MHRRASPPVLVLAVWLMTTGFACGSPSGAPPKSDRCSTPGEVGGAEAVRIGTILDEEGHAAEIEDGAFEPWESGSHVEVVYGAQGGAMIWASFELESDNLPPCVAQETLVLSRDGAELASSRVTVNTHPQEGGRALTENIPLIFYGNVETDITVHSAVAGLDVEMDVTTR